MALSNKEASAFIDLETLGKWDTSVLLSLGITVIMDKELGKNITFSHLMTQSKEFKLDIVDQKARGRTVDTEVFDWWRKQGESAKRVLLPQPDDIKVDVLFQSVEAWLEGYGLTWKTVRIFDRNFFDMPKLQHLNEVTLGNGSRPPWDYKDKWGIETFLKYNSDEQSRYGHIDPEAFTDPEFIYHNAACDAALDALRFNEVFKSAM